jgi:alpha-galactosidase
LVFLLLVPVLFATGRLSAETVWLDKLNVGAATQDWGTPHANQSVDGHALAIGGQAYEHGFGTHAQSTLVVNLNGARKPFPPAWAWMTR